ncbi:MAG TPA: YraN family protein [Terracidiphilus sp.]
MKASAPARRSKTERLLTALDSLARRRGRMPDLPEHLALGEAGEDAAFFELRRKGYMVVARRWRSGDVPGDLDLIAWQGPMLCFVEVKTRSARDLTPAETAVDDHKKRVLRRLARRYVRQLPLKEMPPVRFDVMSVYMEPDKAVEFEHFEATFGWGGGN